MKPGACGGYTQFPSITRSITSRTRPDATEPIGCYLVTAPENTGTKYGNSAMSLLKWALIMAIVSLVAGLLGFYGLSETAGDVARFLFYIFLVIFLVLLVLGLMGARAVRG
jgi:uncharacterized membrane protein YtjA (UPF0391 family)